MTQLSRQLTELAGAARMQTETVEANTRAVIENSLRQASGSKESTAGTIGRTILSFLGGGLGLVQLFGQLFGGSEEEPLPSLTQYSLPPAFQLSAGLTPLGIEPIRYGQDGLPRGAGGATGVTGQPITIQVQAIDSRSFLDHSSEIARAVKEALLHSHSLNDVMAEL
jgi:hypothetical protein